MSRAELSIQHKTKDTWLPWERDCPLNRKFSSVDKGAAPRKSDMKWFGLGAIKPAQAIQEEIDALDGRIEELTAHLADVEQKLRQARDNEQGVQKTIGELQRHQQDAERGLVLVQGAVAAARTKASEKNVSAMEICAGQIRWHNGLLEQLWHIYTVNNIA